MTFTTRQPHDNCFDNTHMVIRGSSTTSRIDDLRVYRYGLISWFICYSSKSACSACLEIWHIYTCVSLELSFKCSCQWYFTIQTYMCSTTLTKCMVVDVLRTWHTDNITGAAQSFFSLHISIQSKK
jgi:hypothetical protein